MDAAAQLRHRSLTQGVPTPPGQVNAECTPASQTAGKPTKKPRERWTPEEHNRFLEGLKMYHRDWRSIEKHVGTKTAVQIRSHAQKFFAKAEREPGTVDFDLPPPRPKRKPGSSQQYGSGSKAGTSTPAHSCLNPDSSPHRISMVPAWPSAGPEMHTLLTQPGLPPRSNHPQQLSQPSQTIAAPQHHDVSSDLMNKIAAAAIAAASTTAHAVISAAGPEYVNVIQDLAKRDRRLSFLSCPISELVSTFAAPPEVPPMEAQQDSAFHVPGHPTVLAPSTSAPVYSNAQAAYHPNAAFSSGGAMAMVPSVGYPSCSLHGMPGTSTMSEPPVQLLNRLLAVPASSQLVNEPGLSHHNERRLNSPGNALSMPPVTSGGLSENMFLPHLDDSMCLTSAIPEVGTQMTPLATFTPPSDPIPSMALPTARMPAVPALIPTQGYVKPFDGNMPFAQQPGNSQVQSIQHAVPADPQKVVMNEAQARQQVQEQQQHQQHVFPKQPPRTPEQPEGTNGYGEQGSGGGSGDGSGGGSGGENHGSGDKSGSKSAKQSGNRKSGDPALVPSTEGLPDPSASQPLTFGMMANMSILQGQGRLTAAQRTEFYKQYYQEMIRRGAEGLRNMNVPVDQPGPPAAAQTPAPTAANAAAAAGLPPATAGVSGKRSGSAREGCAWFGRKKQKTTDTPDVAHAALSSGCEQPAAILGMVPCPTEANILDQGRVLEFHKGTGWATEVEQQDTATSPQGASHGCTTHPDTSHRVHTSAQMPLPEAQNGNSGEGGNQPNSSGEGSNEPGVNVDYDRSGGDQQRAEPIEDGQPEGKHTAELAVQNNDPHLSCGS